MEQVHAEVVWLCYENGVYNAEMPGRFMSRARPRPRMKWTDGINEAIKTEIKMPS